MVVQCTAGGLEAVIEADEPIDTDGRPGEQDEVHLVHVARRPRVSGWREKHYSREDAGASHRAPASVDEEAKFIDYLGAGTDIRIRVGGLHQFEAGNFSAALSVLDRSGLSPDETRLARPSWTPATDSRPLDLRERGTTLT